MEFSKRKFLLDFVEVNMVDNNISLVGTNSKENAEIVIEPTQLESLIKELGTIKQEITVK